MVTMMRSKEQDMARISWIASLFPPHWIIFNIERVNNFVARVPDVQRLSCAFLKIIHPSFHQFAHCEGITLRAKGAAKHNSKPNKPTGNL